MKQNENEALKLHVRKILFYVFSSENEMNRMSVSTQSEHLTCQNHLMSGVESMFVCLFFFFVQFG